MRSKALTRVRRAKIKNIAKRSIESGEDCNNIPESMRQYLAMQQFGPGGKGLHAGLLGRNGAGYGPFGGGVLALNGDSASIKVVIQHFACRSLSVGTWRRVAQTTMDLVIFYSPEKACITYYINNESAGYKIEYPFAWIKNISLEQGDVLAAAEGASQRAGGLVIELSRAPKFYMDSSGSGGFYECGDFTEDQQASQIMIHHLGGPSKVLSGQLAKLISLESYQNRHNVFDPSTAISSAPVSPIPHRPQSQPNHLFHPHSNMTLFPPSDNAPGMMGPPGPRGHKRQRSRSVPAAVDFSMLRHPMPSFLVQHDGLAPQPTIHEHNIFAPIPQHQNYNPFVTGPPGSSLSIDTGFSGFHFGGPVSATTANSPSDFGTPAFFGSAPSGDGMHQPQFSTPFNSNFLAVDQASMIGTSNTPLSVYSHGDPVIADDSPPLNGVGGRSQSNDFFSTPGEHTSFGDEGLYLSETFNKQMSLPFRNSISDESYHSPIPDGTFSFHTPPTEAAHMNGHQTPMNFQTPPQQSHHQDSGVSFSTPTQIHHEQANMYTTPKDGNFYQDPKMYTTPKNGNYYSDNKMYSSPAQISMVPFDSGVYHQSPLRNETTQDELDLPGYGMFSTIDPTALGQQQK